MNEELFDRAVRAAEMIIDHIKDRRGIGNEFDACDDDIKAEILETFAKIIFSKMKGKPV